VRDNVVLLTSRSEEVTLSRLLFDRWNQRQGDDERWDKGNIGSVIELDETISIKVSPSIRLITSQTLSGVFPSSTRKYLYKGLNWMHIFTGSELPRTAKPLSEPPWPGLK
jgi:hypothetical protein